MRFADIGGGLLSSLGLGAPQSSGGQLSSGAPSLSQSRDSQPVGGILGGNGMPNGVIGGVAGDIANDVVNGGDPMRHFGLAGKIGGLIN